MPDDSTPQLPAIPTSKIEEALIHLRRPFAASAVKWKIQSSDYKPAKEGRTKKDATWVLVVPYVDARLVSARLNAVVAGGWQEAPVERIGELLRYKLTVLDQTHTDVGEGQGRTTGMKVKAADSDALKRVAVRFGVGEYLYAMPAFNFFVTPKGEVQDDKPTVRRMDSGKPGYLKAPHEDWLREAYERWLEEEGAEKFGPVLDHGDAAKGSIGQLLDQAGAPDETEISDDDLRPAALDDDEAKQLRDRIAGAFDSLCEVNPNRLTQDRYESLVTGAAHSHAELERVATTIENLRDTEQRLGELREQLVEKVGQKAAKPLIDSAERRGSQEERIASLEKALEEAGEGAA